MLLHTSICYQTRRSEIGDKEKESSKNSKIDENNNKTSTMLTQKQIEAKMMLDTVSQRSYISQKVRRHLNLKTIRRDIYR